MGRDRDWQLRRNSCLTSRCQFITRQLLPFILKIEVSLAFTFQKSIENFDCHYAAVHRFCLLDACPDAAEPEHCP